MSSTTQKPSSNKFTVTHLQLIDATSFWNYSIRFSQMAENDEDDDYYDSRHVALNYTHLLAQSRTQRHLDKCVTTCGVMSSAWQVVSRSHHAANTEGEVAGMSATEAIDVMRNTSQHSAAPTTTSSSSSTFLTGSCYSYCLLLERMWCGRPLLNKLKH